MNRRLSILFVFLIFKEVLTKNDCYYCINCSRYELGKKVVKCENGCLIAKGEFGFVQKCYSKSIENSEIYGRNYKFCQNDLCNVSNRESFDDEKNFCYFCLHCKQNQLDEKRVQCKNGCFIGKSIYGFIQQCHFPLVEYKIMFGNNFTICNKSFCNDLKTFNKNINNLNSNDSFLSKLLNFLLKKKSQN